MKKPELLIPAGSMEVLKTAVRYGADAVYIGGPKFGLRANAGNFTKEQMTEAVRYAHEHGVRVYVTVNIFAHNRDIEALSDYLAGLKDVMPDALIISDPGVFMMAKEILPKMELHVSTQANNTNYETFLFWHRLGAKRVVCARELSLKEIEQIRKHIPEDMEIEAFVHGAMCISYSGRCLLSNYFTRRDANMGACTHPCRWKYHVVEETRPGEYLPVEEDDSGTYIFNSKDLNMIAYVPELVNAGIDSFKVEGRMKTALYAACVTRTYRKAIDDYFRSEVLYRQAMSYYTVEIAKCTYRQFTTGFYFERPDESAQIYDSNTYIKEYTFIGIVDGRKKEHGRTLLCWRQKNKFSCGDLIEAMGFDGENTILKVKAIYDEHGEAMESAPHPKQLLYVDLGCELCDGVVLRKETVSD